MKKKSLITSLAACALLSFSAQAADYKIDKKGMHAAIQFKISHLGYSWLWGRFNDFEGEFSYDALQPNNSKVNVVINTASVDSNHERRDGHLRGKKFLNVKEFPQATFNSTSFKTNKDGTHTLTGDLTIKGITKSVDIAVNKLGEGKDPWGGYRVGFEGITRIALKDFGIMKNLGEASKELDIILSIEGIRK